MFLALVWLSCLVVCNGLEVQNLKFSFLDSQQLNVGDVSFLLVPDARLLSSFQGKDTTIHGFSLPFHRKQPQFRLFLLSDKRKAVPLEYKEIVIQKENEENEIGGCFGAVFQEQKGCFFQVLFCNTSESEIEAISSIPPLVSNRTNLPPPPSLSFSKIIIFVGVEGEMERKNEKVTFVDLNEETWSIREKFSPLCPSVSSPFEKEEKKVIKQSVFRRIFETTKNNFKLVRAKESEDEDMSDGEISGYVMLGCFGAFMIVTILVVIFSGNRGLKIR